MDRTFGFYPHGLRNPFIQEIKSHEDNTLVFDGYFYVDNADLPVQRIMVRFGEEYKDDDGNSYRSAITDYHIEIYEKISGEDTSVFSQNEDLSGNRSDSEDNICFFPTEITTLKYRVIKSDLTQVERDMILEHIKEKEKEREKNKVEAMLRRLDEVTH